jgi:CDP-paratose 2-epimerase
LTRPHVRDYNRRRPVTPTGESAALWTQHGRGRFVGVCNDVCKDDWIARMKRLLVTGSAGLIGSEICLFFAQRGYEIHGIDNNQRASFFGAQGDTSWNLRRLQRRIGGYRHNEVDIRDRAGIARCLNALRPDAIVHTAAQPSHDLAAQIPFDDFDTNAVGTVNLLEAARQACPEAPFVHMSTNKVYGDRPNHIPMVESPTRWEYADEAFEHGISEDFPIDQSMHSLFGASKVAADVMVQEYGRYFSMPTCCLRGGCLTGPNHSGVQLHGFLSYLVKSNLEGQEYTIFGYKGKQVRDNIHSEDVARFVHEFVEAPRSGEVYNLGGGKENSCSILEAFAIVERLTGKKQRHRYDPESRRGDHICYYSDLRKMQSHFPRWAQQYTLEQTIEQIVQGWHDRMQAGDA